MLYDITFHLHFECVHHCISLHCQYVYHNISCYVHCQCFYLSTSLIVNLRIVSPLSLSMFVSYCLFTVYIINVLSYNLSTLSVFLALSVFEMTPFQPIDWISLSTDNGVKVAHLEKVKSAALIGWKTVSVHWVGVVSWLVAMWDPWQYHGGSRIVKVHYFRSIGSHIQERCAQSAVAVTMQQKLTWLTSLIHA